jgi:hypothetical protein
MIFELSILSPPYHRFVTSPGGGKATPTGEQSANLKSKSWRLRDLMEMQLPGKETQSGWVVVKLLHQGQGNVGTKASNMVYYKDGSTWKRDQVKNSINSHQN